MSLCLWFFQVEIDCITVNLTRGSVEVAYKCMDCIFCNGSSRRERDPEGLRHTDARIAVYPAVGDVEASAEHEYTS